jgi:hypothetical protein
MMTFHSRRRALARVTMTIIGAFGRQGNLNNSETIDPQTRRASRIPRDIVLIVLGALVAMGADEWRDARHRRAQVRTALTSIRDELRANVVLVTRAREQHVFLEDTLSKLAARKMQPSPEIYGNGMVKPAPVTSMAWDLARETGALSDIPLSTVLDIAPAYAAQARYQSIVDALAVDIMSDVRRSGMDAVLRDRFAQFIPLDIDFKHREGGLLSRYKVALARLDSALR